eukprot:15366719-Ditylum_brightwellii.AAC.1
MQVEVIIKHIRCGDEIDTWDIPHLEGVWLKNFQDGLDTIGGTIELEHDWIRAPVWLHDKHIMQIFLESDAVEKQDLKSHQMVQQYTQGFYKSPRNN